MIPQAAIQAWATTRPWPTLVSGEQDLLPARLIVEVAHHPLLGDELVFRGGTCLHQLVLDQPLRYSEDRPAPTSGSIRRSGSAPRVRPTRPPRCGSRSRSTPTRPHRRGHCSGCPSRSRTRGSGFDLWLALTGAEIVSAFGPYRPAGLTPTLAEANLRAKLDDPAFRNDLNALVAEWPRGYTIDSAAELVIAEVLGLL